jgi:hypothetical protein
MTPRPTTATAAKNRRMASSARPRETGAGESPTALLPNTGTPVIVEARLLTEHRRAENAVFLLFDASRPDLACCDHDERNRTRCQEGRQGHVEDDVHASLCDPSKFCLVGAGRYHFEIVAHAFKPALRLRNCSRPLGVHPATASQRECPGSPGERRSQLERLVRQSKCRGS